MSLSSSTAGWIAIGAAVAADRRRACSSCSSGWTCAAPAASARPLLGRERQRRRDLVDFAITLQGRVDDLHRAVDEIAAAVARVDRRMDATLARTAIVRYDAYEQAGGRQSASVALLDANRTGIVLSAIQGRDYARVYVKELDQGKASVALSPEEQQAVERAMAR